MLDWLYSLHQTNPVAHSLGIISLVCAAGMALGSVNVRGIGLGSAGVLFMGILVAQFTEPVDKHTLDFVKDFGLVLFVFTIGLQLGPGFLASMRAQGLRLNLLAAVLVLLGGLMAALLGWLVGLEPAAVAGLFAGASTNTPALGAAQLTLATTHGVSAEILALPALSCAVAYPAAIFGLLGTLVLLKIIFRIDPAKEAEVYEAERRKAVEPLSRRTLIIENPNLDGVSLDEAYQCVGEGIVISRIRSVDETNVRVALHSTKLHVGDRVLAVGTMRMLDRFQRVVGRKSDEDLLFAPGNVTSTRIAVTNKIALGRTIAELGLSSLSVDVTRITRGEVEMTAVPSLRLQFGDVLQVVGTKEQLQKASDLFGNSLKRLNETQFIPLFAGIFLGVLVGSIPLYVPFLPHPLRMGLAAGPLVVALIVGRIGHLGGLVWHMPENANHAFREFGVALFFAALGLAAGEQFLAAVLSRRGLIWLVTGAIVTIVPLLAVGLWARIVEKMNFVTLSGLLSGGMTNPPALTFANNLCRSETPTLAYASVYPLTTLLRVVVAQILALLVY